MLKYKKYLSANFLLITIWCICFSCTKDSAPPAFGDYPTEIGKIMTYKCATSGCHNSASAKGAAGLDLSTFNALFKGSNSGSPVIPFRSDFSSLCYFVNTYDELGPKNLPTMPLYQNALSREEVSAIKNWIDAGAPDINGNIKWNDDPLRKKYYVLNQGCDVVTVFDAATQLPIRYITVGSLPNASESPHMIRVSPDGNYWYVIFIGNNIIQKFRTSDDSFVAYASLGSYLNWNTMAISNDGKKAYCLSYQINSSSCLAVVNLENMQLDRIAVGGNFIEAHGIALNHTNDTLYITRQSGNYIYKIDTAFNTGFQEISLDGNNPSQTSSLDPHEIMFSTDGSKYFVTCQKTNEVRVMSTLGNNLLQVIPTGTYPQEITKSELKNKVYVVCSDDVSGANNIKGSVTVIDMDNFSYNNFPVGYQPHGIAINEKQGYIIVASRNIISTGPVPHHTGVCGRNGFVSYFNLNTMQLLTKKTEVASDPYSVAIRP